MQAPRVPFFFFCHVRTKKHSSRSMLRSSLCIYNHHDHFHNCYTGQSNLQGRGIRTPENALSNIRRQCKESAARSGKKKKKPLLECKCCLADATPLANAMPKKIMSIEEEKGSIFALERKSQPAHPPPPTTLRKTPQSPPAPTSQRT